jgi:DNA-binding transcriptional regulator LsrR (DeoR family)
VPVRDPSGPTVPAGSDQLDLIVEIATWFYVHGWSQIRIARKLGLDPSTVSRYLKRAREEAIVHVEIRRPPKPSVDLARDLAEQLGIARAVVVPDSDHPLETVAAAAAEHIDGLLRSGSRLGISWGHTLAAVVRHLRIGSVSGLEISQLAGGLEESAQGIQGHELVRALGAAFPGSRMRYLHAPAIVDSPTEARVILGVRTVATALDAAATSDIALVGIGSMHDAATLVRGGHVSPQDRRRLVKQGAVGNMNTRFFDADGVPVGDLDARTIAVSWDELRAIHTVIAVAAGEHKAAAIAGAVRSGCIDVLVTDEPVARRLLAAEPPARPGQARGSGSESLRPSAA